MTASAIGASLANGVRLLSAEAPAESGPRGFVQLTLVWTASAPVDQNLTVFAHLIGADGKLLAQDDSLPADGFRPTTSWQPGERVVDHHRFSLPADASVDGASLAIGLYSPDTGARVRVLGSDGLPADDKIVLGLESGRLVRR
jgi:hypothetical protein